MVTLKDCYNNDAPGISIHTTFLIEQFDENDELIFAINIDFKISPQLQSKTGENFYIYIPQNPHPLYMCGKVMREYKEYKKTMGVRGRRGFNVITGTKEIGKEPKPLDILYIYLEDNIIQRNLDLSELNKIAEELGIVVKIRDEVYSIEREKTIKSLAFISHDTRDKELIARPIADAISRKLYKVWYDEYSLKIGDNLRESIEQGIKEAKKCILILTPNFLNNSGWTKKEFDSIFTKEIIDRKGYILPIWYGVTPYDVYNYSPSLANTVALHWPDKKTLNDNDYKQAVDRISRQIIHQLDN